MEASESNPEPYSGDGTVIPSTADPVAYRANMRAIDEQVAPKTYAYIIAWGKWLGFTPFSVQRSVDEAVVDNAPLDVIQKIDGKWLHLDGIANDTNRNRVMALANPSARGSWNR